MGALDNLDDFCRPVSQFWVGCIIDGSLVDYIVRHYYSLWLHHTSSLQRRENYCSSPYFPKNFSCSGHDHVDLSLCFEDTAILYGICALFWILAGFKFLCGNNVKPSIRFNLLHMAKLVSLLLCIRHFWRMCQFSLKYQATVLPSSGS